MESKRSMSPFSPVMDGILGTWHIFAHVCTQHPYCNIHCYLQFPSQFGILRCNTALHLHRRHNISTKDHIIDNGHEGRGRRVKMATESDGTGRNGCWTCPSRFFFVMLRRVLHVNSISSGKVLSVLDLGSRLGSILAKVNATNVGQRVSSKIKTTAK